jgi:hypothetical protein
MKHLALTVALLAAPCVAAPALTTIVDTLYKADGTRFEGVAQIEWKSFQASDGSEIPQQTLNVKVVAGNLRIALVPTVNASKPVTYTVKFNSNGRTQFTEYWSVPTSTTPLRLQNVRSQSQAGPITSPDAAEIDDITGLRAELDVRPTKGNGYANSRAAVINASGSLNGAIGNAGDCVRVDGTSGPCGSTGGGGPLFVDDETPSGPVDGENTSFTLTSPPTPPASLNLYRNGILMRQGVGYTLSGNTITILSGSIPVSGDSLQAWYRIPGIASQTVNFSEDETPAGIVDSSNAVFTLESIPAPASSLQLFRNGVLQKSGMDYLLSSKTVTFSSWAIPQPGDVLQVSYRR